jgi:hypothetical protein
MMVLPCWCSRSNSAMISLPVAVSRLPVGSSASRIEGLLTRARATATRWRWPPESSLGLWYMRDSRSTWRMAMLGPLEALVGRHAGIDQGQFDIVQRRGARQQVEGLEHEADFLVADARQFVVRHVADQVAVDVVLPAGRRIQTADQVHQGRLARARRTHDGDILAALDLDIDAGNGVDLLSPMT